MLGLIGVVLAVAASVAPAPKAVWLCRPGLADNPCTSDMTATVVGRTGVSTVQRSARARHPKVDCFYVYPTVSSQQTTNSNLQVDPQERAVAVIQASRFSSVCRVFAPMYPQLTLHAILTPGGITAQGAATAYLGLASAFHDYLAHDNHGRGIVFIGHSQGAALLIALLRREVDATPSLRRRVVSALLLGGNVTVPHGKRVGGDFQHIPACSSARETGCVVAYSSFDRTPPADSKFGRVGLGLNPFQPSAGAGLQVMCVNPAAPAGGRAPLAPYFTTGSVAGQRARGRMAIPSTPWVTYPREYTAQCRSAGGASWLQVGHDSDATDRRPVLTGRLGPAWGLHAYDVNLALGNLVGLVRAEIRAYRR